MFARNNKHRLLIECLYEQWAPYPGKCKRGAETVALIKNGWIFEFGQVEVLLFRPWGKRYVKAKRLVYKDIAFVDPQRGMVQFENHKPYGVSFSLKRPELGFLGLPARKPDFDFLKQFVGPIQDLGERLGRAPLQTELVDHVHGLINGALTKKALIKIFHEGNGYFWESELISGPPYRRAYYLRPGVGIKTAEQIWEERENERIRDIDVVCSGVSAGLSCGQTAPPKKRGAKKRPAASS